MTILSIDASSILKSVSTKQMLVIQCINDLGIVVF